MEKKSTTLITVKFNKNYVASRGPGIAGAKGEQKKLRQSAALVALIKDGIVDVVKETEAAGRKKATGKKGAEKS